MQFALQYGRSPSFDEQPHYSYSIPSLNEVKEQIVSYFNERTGNEDFRWSSEKLESRFKYGCRQVEAFNSLQKRVAKSKKLV